MAAYFCRMADTVGIPRSVALIYHALFVSSEPLSFTEIVENSGLSKASASTGLKMLERMHAAEVVVIPDVRGTYYKPELSVRRLVSGFLEESLVPGLEAGGRLLGETKAQLGEGLSPHLAERLSSLLRWHALTGDLLPALALLDPASPED
jgi:DNA-binding transcriptional regulator GbsR (MarR family)